MGRMTSHMLWKNNPNVPNYQPDEIFAPSK
jgi:hypothetical protein